MRTPNRITVALVVGSFIAGAISAVVVLIVIEDHVPADRTLRSSAVSVAPSRSGESPSGTAREDPGDLTGADQLPAFSGDPAPHVARLRRRSLLVPVEGVSPRQLQSSFRDARSGGRTHEAMDILAPRGTPVHAVADGTIAKLFTSDAGGLTVYQFDEAQQYAFYYAHLDRYAPNLAERQRVSRGDVLGVVGTTGNAPPDTPHLHFAIFVLGPERRWWQGDPIDPFGVFRPADQ